MPSVVFVVTFVFLCSESCEGDTNVSVTDIPTGNGSLYDNGYLLRQGMHPHPKRFTRIRHIDPIPPSIELLKTQTDKSNHIIHSIFNNTKLELLVMIESTPSSNQWRQVIRDTWGRKEGLPHRTDIVFVIPVFNNYDDNDLLNEMELYRDILLFKQISIFTINSVKLINYLYWCSMLYDYKYLLRTNDKYFIRIDKIVNSLASYDPADLLYSGYFKGNVQVGKKDILWLVCPTYTPHADKGAYILSRSLIDRFIKQFYYWSYFHSEGASVGLWTSLFKRVRLIHRMDFDCNVSRGCKNNLLTIKETAINEMTTRYTRLENGGHFCREEVTIEETYDYNWSDLPSQCCRQSSL